MTFKDFFLILLLNSGDVYLYLRKKTVLVRLEQDIELRLKQLKKMGMSGSNPSLESFLV